MQLVQTAPPTGSSAADAGEWLLFDSNHCQKVDAATPASVVAASLGSPPPRAATAAAAAMPDLGTAVAAASPACRASRHASLLGLHIAVPCTSAAAPVDGLPALGAVAAPARFASLPAQRNALPGTSAPAPVNVLAVLAPAVPAVGQGSLPRLYIRLPSAAAAAIAALDDGLPAFSAALPDGVPASLPASCVQLPPAVAAVELDDGLPAFCAVLPDGLPAATLLDDGSPAHSAALPDGLPADAVSLAGAWAAAAAGSSLPARTAAGTAATSAACNRGNSAAASPRWQPASSCPQAATPAHAALAQLGSLYLNEKTGQICKRCVWAGSARSGWRMCSLRQVAVPLPEGRPPRESLAASHSSAPPLPPLPPPCSTAVDGEGHMGYLPAGISVEELLNAAEDLQQMMPTPMPSRPGARGASPGSGKAPARAGCCALPLLSAL